MVGPWRKRPARRFRNLRPRKTPSAVIISTLPPVADEDESPVESINDPSPLPAELAEHHGLQRLLQEASAALPPRYRLVVAMRYTTDLTFAEIAATLDAPENT